MSMSTIWIGWRLLVGKGGGLRQAGLITLGVTIGSALLFSMASIPSAVADRQARDSLREWLTSGAPTQTAEGSGLIAVGHDRFGDQSLTHLLVAPGSDREVEPALGDRLPATGQVLVSPALQDAIASQPSLADRLIGDVVGTVSPGFLLEPDEMISMAVVEAEAIVATGEAQVLRTDAPPEADVIVPAPVMFVVTIALLVLAMPVAIFISSATRFGLERRRSRVRVLTLAGAERKQIRLFVAMEAVSAASLGVLLGFGLCLLTRPLLAQLTVGGRSAFSSALRPSLVLAAAAAGFVLVAAFIASLAGSRRLEREPLESASRRRSSMVGPVLITVGFAGLAVGLSSPSTSDVPHPLALVGMVALAVGVTIAVKVVIGMIGRRVGSGTGDGVILLAARQMDRCPGEVSRPLAAVVIAVFVVAAFFTITGTLLRSSNFRYDGLAPDRVLIEAPPDLLRGIRDHIEDRPEVEALALQGLVSVATDAGEQLGLGVVAECEAVGQVAGFDGDGCHGGVLVSAGEHLDPGTTLVLGSSPPLEVSGATTTVSFDGSTFGLDYPASVIVDASLVPDEFAGEISEAQIVIRVDSEQGSAEALRSAVVGEFPTAWVRSVTEIELDQAASAREMRTLTMIGLGIILGLAAFSLSVGTASRLLERRDAFAFLRAGGLLAGQIRRLVALESILPLAFFTAFSALLGVAAGAAVAVSAGTQVEVPWATIAFVYLGAVCLGVLVWAAFAPSLDRLTSPAGLRFE
jgi:hypothetical protein